MAIHIDDALTESVAHELARRRGISVTEAIKQAVEKTLVDDAKAAQAKTAHPGG